MEMNHGMPTLEGPDFVLKPIKRSDSPAILAMLAQPGVARWWGAYDADRLERDFFEPAWTYTYVVIVAGEVAGILQFHEVPDPDYETAAIDITLGDRYQDRGLGTQCLRTLIRYLIEERGHHRMTIDPAMDNPRAIHVYEKVGFRPVGVMRRYERGADGTWHDNLLLDLLADEFDRT